MAGILVFGLMLLVALNWIFTAKVGFWIFVAICVYFGCSMYSDALKSLNAPSRSTTTTYAPQRQRRQRSGHNHVRNDGRYSSAFGGSSPKFHRNRGLRTGRKNGKG